MGWSERGKRGIHSGRTVRRSYASHKQRDGVILKYQENAADIPNSTKRTLLQDRYGLTDGLHMNYVPHLRNDTGVEFSLGKRKRWLLRDLVKERNLDELCNTDDNDDDGIELEENEADVHVCFQERHIMPDFMRNRGDCVSIYSDHDGETYPKRHYSFYVDINHPNKPTKPAQVGYEICNPPSASTWPNFNEKQYLYQYRDLEGRKAKCKCKGLKNKGDRFGLKNEELTAYRHKRKQPTKSEQDCKVKIMSKEEFQFSTKNMDTTKSCGGSIYLDDALAQTSKKAHGLINQNEESSPNFSESKKYGKGCTVFVENPPMKSEPLKIPQEIQPKRFIDLQHKVDINVDVKDVEASSLLNAWGESYTEGVLQPRKFAINITSGLPKLKDNSTSYVLFELQDKHSMDKTHVVSAVSLVHVSIGDNSNLESIAKDFVSYIARVSHCNTGPWQVKNVVQAALQCVKIAKGLPVDTASDEPVATKTSSVKSVTPVTNLNLLNRLYGWESEAVTFEDAQQQIKEKLEMEANTCSSKNEGTVDSSFTIVSTECGICYGSFEDNPVTTLTRCGHSFCNECWVGHLETQVSQGIEHVKCPGYDCDCKVDHIIMMSLNPQLYERYMNTLINKHLEMSSDWKWCPGKHCQKLVKAANRTNSNNGITVQCSCTSTWCFKCQQKSHWPATCKESEKFFTKSGYAEYLLQQESKELISSVMVKNCPQCNYPIEKYHGCQFMHCVLCNSHFCWNCVTLANYGHTCENKPKDNLTEVVLINNRKKRIQVQKFLQIVLDSTKARLPSLVYAKRKKVDQLQAAQSSYCSIAMIQGDSRLSQFMETIVDKQGLERVKHTVEFEYQARIILEGLAQKAAISRALDGKIALTKMRQLVFITGRIDSVLKEQGLMQKLDRLSWLERLVDIGTECISSLKDIFA